MLCLIPMQKFDGKNWFSFPISTLLFSSSSFSDAEKQISIIISIQNCWLVDVCLTPRLFIFMCIVV